MENRAVFVRQDLIPPQTPPTAYRGVLGWIHRNLFTTPVDGLITLVLLIATFYVLVPAISWSFVDAAWSGTDRRACTTVAQGGIQPDGWSGACWAFVRANFWQFIYGSYPAEERWRVALTALIAVIVNIPLLLPSVGHKLSNGLASLFVVPIIGYVLLFGGYLGLTPVTTDRWGGLMVTLIIAYSSITISLPLGTLLALGRRSSMTVVRLLCVIFIETLRGVPLVGLLFIASLLFPLFLPNGMSFDKFLRALIAVALFTSVYIAEVIRGGLQAVPRNQYEAAWSLGFKYWGMTCFVILPQAFRLVIPGIINTLIGMFKDTSLVYIISMADLLAIARRTSQQAEWSTPQTPATAFIYAGLIFWVFCFAMSRYAHFIEKRMNIPHNSSSKK